MANARVVVSEPVQTDASPGPVKRPGFIPVAGIALPLLVLASLLVANLMRPVPVDNDALSSLGLVVLDQPRTVEPFDLKDHEGTAIRQFADRWTLVFFGFTHCPDICPTTLSVMNQLAVSMGPNQPEVVMITVDPGRDTAQNLNQYVTAFNPDFRSLSGTAHDIRQLGDQLQVVFEEQGDGPDYQVGHTTHIAVINPTGEFMGYFRVPHRSASMQQALTTVMAR